MLAFHVVLGRICPTQHNPTQLFNLIQLYLYSMCVSITISPLQGQNAAQVPIQDDTADKGGWLVCLCDDARTHTHTHKCLHELDIDLRA